MRRCPTCQRTFSDDSLTFCLDDGSPLLGDESSWATSAPTAVIPDPRVTNPVSYPLAASTGLQLSNRTIAIIGASLLVIGFFMPVVSFLGLITVSYFQLMQFSAAFFTGALLAGIGIIAFVLAMTGKYRPLIALGSAAIIILIIDFLRIKSAIAGGLPLDLPGAPRGVDTRVLGQALSNAIQISFGIFVMLAGAILLIVAGVRKK